MDLLHTGQLHGFYLVSSDSDFTRFATRIREAGLLVYGFGESKTPAPFVAACEKFAFAAILTPKSGSEIVSAAQAMPPLDAILRPAIQATAQGSGWSPRSAVGWMVAKNHPSFDARKDGFAKLDEPARKQNYLEIKEVAIGDGPANVHRYVRVTPN